MDFISLPGLPKWAFTVILALLAIGALTVIGGIGWGIYWLISHLRWS